MVTYQFMVGYHNDRDQWWNNVTTMMNMGARAHGDGDVLRKWLDSAKIVVHSLIDDNLRE